MNWPQQAKVAQTTVKNANTIRKAFNQAFDADAITAAWIESHPNKESMTAQSARDWSLAHVQYTQKPIQLALTRTYADSWVLGDRVASARLLGAMANKSATAGVVDWATWTPGMSSAAALVKPGAGLKQLLDSRRITVANEVTRTKLDRIGTALHTSLEGGYSASRTANLINEVINDPQHALVIARTETARAMSVATRERYESSNVQQVEWLVAEGCEICQENADASPIGIDETFPTGDSEPPAHPNCMCAIAPVFDDSDLPALEEEGVDGIEPLEGDLPQEVADQVETLPTESEVVQQEKPTPTLPEIVETLKNNPYIPEQPGDNQLGALQELAGYNALPKLVSEAQMEELAAQGWTRVWRGVRDLNAKDFLAPQLVEEFKRGPHFPGLGIYGNGTYTSTNIVTAGNYAEGDIRNLITMAISPTAKVAKYDALVKEADRAKNKRINEGISARSPELALYEDLGKFAISQGYDVIERPYFDGEIYYIVLNRGKVAVVD